MASKVVKSPAGWVFKLMIQGYFQGFLHVAQNLILVFTVMFQT